MWRDTFNSERVASKRAYEMIGYISIGRPCVDQNVTHILILAICNGGNISPVVGSSVRMLKLRYISTRFDKFVYYRFTPLNYKHIIN